MNEWGKASAQRRGTLCPELQLLCDTVLPVFDCSIICGWRGEADQMAAYHDVPRKSWAKFGQSPHNFFPSLAVDLMPYPIDWNDRERIILFAGHVLGMAGMMGINVKWGGDWNQNKKITDERFHDFPHFEITDWRDREKVLRAL